MIVMLLCLAGALALFFAAGVIRVRPPQGAVAGVAAQRPGQPVSEYTHPDWRDDTVLEDQERANDRDEWAQALERWEQDDRDQVEEHE